MSMTPMAGNIPSVLVWPYSPKTILNARAAFVSESLIIDAATYSGVDGCSFENSSCPVLDRTASV